MDINSPKGQKSLLDERRMAKWLEEKFKLQYIETPKNFPATIDAVLVKEGEMKAIVETKCRYKLTLEKFNTAFEFKWLITWAKVQNAITIANSLGVPCVGFLYLVDENILLSQKISEPDGRLLVNISLSTTETQATINGGLAVRTNAFIDMRKAKVFCLNDIKVG